MKILLKLSLSFVGIIAIFATIYYLQWNLMRCEQCVRWMEHPYWNVPVSTPELPDERFEVGYSCYEK